MVNVRRALVVRLRSGRSGSAEAQQIVQLHNRDRVPRRHKPIYVRFGAGGVLPARSNHLPHLARAHPGHGGDHDSRSVAARIVAASDLHDPTFVGSPFPFPWYGVPTTPST